MRMFDDEDFMGDEDRYNKNIIPDDDYLINKENVKEFKGDPYYTMKQWTSQRLDSLNNGENHIQDNSFKSTCNSTDDNCHPSTFANLSIVNDQLIKDTGDVLNNITNKLYEKENPFSIKEKNYEMVDHPQHYGGKDNPYEAIKVIEAWDLNFNLGSCLKYISRKSKPDASLDEKHKRLEDLKKAAWYAQREVERFEKELKVNNK